MGENSNRSKLQISISPHDGTWPRLAHPLQKKTTHATIQMHRVAHRHKHILAMHTPCQVLIQRKRLHQQCQHHLHQRVVRRPVMEGIALNWEGERDREREGGSLLEPGFDGCVCIEPCPTLARSTKCGCGSPPPGCTSNSIRPVCEFLSVSVST